MFKVPNSKKGGCAEDVTLQISFCVVGYSFYKLECPIGFLFYFSMTGMDPSRKSIVRNKKGELASTDKCGFPPGGCPTSGRGTESKGRVSFRTGSFSASLTQFGQLSDHSLVPSPPKKIKKENKRGRRQWLPAHLRLEQISTLCSLHQESNYKSKGALQGNVSFDQLEKPDTCRLKLSLFFWGAGSEPDRLKDL